MLSPDDLLPTPAGYATPGQIAQSRQDAARLQQQNAQTGTIHSPSQGIAEVVRAMVGGLEQQEADRQENFARSGVANQLAKLFSGQGGGGDSSIPTMPTGSDAGGFAPGSLPVPMEAAKAAIRGNEADARGYGTIGPMITNGEYAGDRAYGAYQVMGKDLPDRLTKAGLPQMSPAQFLASPQA
jgi:hypothetical protein